jgi:ATP-dependent DNA ligase
MWFEIGIWDSVLRHLDGDGATVFKHACKLGLEGIVSQRRDLPYRSGRCRAWIKIKNPASPAMLCIEHGRGEQAHSIGPIKPPLEND